MANATPTCAVAVSAIGVGASTGGPRALRTVLRGLPSDYPVPLLVVQHIGPESLVPLVQWLDAEVPLPVQVARDGLSAGPGVWVAPPGSHLVLRPSMRMSLDLRRGSETHQPSIDVLLQSLAASLGRRAVGLVLSGMGTDGARGVAAVTAADGLAIAQDEASSAVFGMPRAAAAHGAQLTLAVDEIAASLRSLRPAREAR
jgi:two-component system chemotaxis response regulator CheB